MARTIRKIIEDQEVFTCPANTTFFLPFPASGLGGAAADTSTTGGVIQCRFRPARESTRSITSRPWAVLWQQSVTSKW